MTVTSFALPGQILGPASKHIPGPGTHLHLSHICASLPGLVSESTSGSDTSVFKPSNAKGTSTSASANLTTISVTAPRSTSSSSASSATLLPTTTVLPTVDATVLAKVTRINPRQATVEILVVGESVCVEGWQGLIRAQDIRATEKDRVKVVESFRPGDLVRAVVISLGDQSNYYLSTASNMLGVVMATSEEGNAMFPVSWKEFRDPVTGKGEPRKVAKPF